MLNKKFKQSFNLWREAKQYHIVTDDSPSQGTCNTPSFPTVADYDGLEQNTLETNLTVNALLLP